MNLVILDAGARYGLHPTFESLKELAEFHLFEMDETECERLQKKYREQKNITVHPTALYSKQTTLEFQVNSHKALNSLNEANLDLLKKRNHYVEEFQPTSEKISVETDTVDHLFEQKEIHLMKLDVEGAEIDVLEGSEKKLGSETIGIRSEVAFSRVYQNCPLFGDIFNHLDKRGYEFLSLDYNGKGSPSSAFTRNDRYGRLMTTDGLWILNEETLLSGTESSVHKKTLRAAIFLFQNKLTDIAIDLMLKATRLKKIDYSKDESLLSLYLKKEILVLFKELSYLPSMDKGRLENAYQTLYHESFPKMNEFYESKYFDS